MYSKAQAGYMDFTIATFLFIFTLIIYFNYTNNIQKEESDVSDYLLTESQSISSSLVLSGFPSDWNNDTVIRIGIADEQRINASKLRNFKILNYTKIKRSFGTPYEYFIYFVNKQGDVLNINGICGVGHPLVNFTYNAKSAYYYKNPSNSFLKDYMIKMFKADVYFDDDANDVDDIDGLTKNISKYNFIVMENPTLSTAKLDQYYRSFNNYTARGGNIFIGGLLVNDPSSKYFNGISFDKKTGQTNKQRTALISNTDPLLDLVINESMTFGQYYFVHNDTPPAIITDQSNPSYNPVQSLNYNIIADYNNSNDEAVASWQYGNGTVYFFSDFDASEFSGGNFMDVSEHATLGLSGGTCSPINLTNINIKNLAKTERYLIFKSDIVKMVIFSWQ